jgi:hypothetical protein
MKFKKLYGPFESKEFFSDQTVATRLLLSVSGL